MTFILNNVCVCWKQGLLSSKITLSPRSDVEASLVLPASLWVLQIGRGLSIFTIVQSFVKNPTLRIVESLRFFPTDKLTSESSTVS